MFAQETIKPDQVMRELRAVQAAIGSTDDVAQFTREALALHKASVSVNGKSPSTSPKSPVPSGRRSEIAPRSWPASSCPCPRVSSI